MKKESVWILSILLWVAPALSGQPQPGVPGQLPPGYRPSAGEPREPLTTFDLDFRGGTPRELVKAIEKSSGKPLNAIIPDEYSNEQLPPMKMRAVTAPQLFEALSLASQKTVYVTTGTSQGGSFGPFGSSQSYTSMTIAYGFKTQEKPTDTSIWCFYKIEPRTPPAVSVSPQLKPEVCRYYQLGPYLDKALKIEDITTAIQTGLKMLGEPESSLRMSFHKETKLLIAVGSPERLQLIDEVLSQLLRGQSAPPSPAVGTAPRARMPSLPPPPAAPEAARP